MTRTEEKAKKRAEKMLNSQNMSEAEIEDIIGDISLTHYTMNQHDAIRVIDRLVTVFADYTQIDKQGFVDKLYKHLCSERKD